MEKEEGVCRFMRKAPSYSPWSLSINIAGPTRSNDTEKPRKRGMESFSMRNIFICACDVNAIASITRLMAILLDIEVEMIV